jgi:hypothetical protein
MFGRLGEGKNNYPGTADPFFWGTAEAAKKPTLIVSMFPNAHGDAGLAAAADKNTLKAKSGAWVSYNTFNAPSQPSAAVDPDSAGA